MVFSTQILSFRSTDALPVMWHRKTLKRQNKNFVFSVTVKDRGLDVGTKKSAKFTRIFQ